MWACAGPGVCAGGCIPREREREREREKERERHTCRESAQPSVPGTAHLPCSESAWAMPTRKLTRKDQEGSRGGGGSGYRCVTVAGLPIYRAEF